MSQQNIFSNFEPQISPTFSSDTLGAIAPILGASNFSSFGAKHRN